MRCRAMLLRGQVGREETGRGSRTSGHCAHTHVCLQPCRRCCLPRHMLLRARMSCLWGQPSHCSKHGRAGRC